MERSDVKDGCFQGPLAQIIALTIHGNVALRSATPGRATVFFPQNTTFQFCEFVTFTSHDGVIAAPDPLAWYEHLQAAGVKALRLTYEGRALPNDRMHDRETVGLLGGGPRWFMEAVLDRGLHSVWEATWTVGDRDRKDRRIWRVDYARTPGRRSLAPSRPDLDDVRARLSVALRAIVAFSRRESRVFSRFFESALVRLTSAEPLNGLFHYDLVPASKPLAVPAAQLLGAAHSAWVFGGMGSWNDMAFEGRHLVEYAKLSDDLFWLLCRSISAAANASAPQGENGRGRPWWRLW